jgi:hypothetical protein
MAKLSTAARKKLPGKDFAGPGRSFPEEDDAHRRAAIRLAPRALKAGHITKSEEEHIISRARAGLGNSHGTKHKKV